MPGDGSSRVMADTSSQRPEPSRAGSRSSSSSPSPQPTSSTRSGPDASGRESMAKLTNSARQARMAGKWVKWTKARGSANGVEGADRWPFRSRSSAT